jgi:hypothetical protein
MTREPGQMAKTRTDHSASPCGQDVTYALWHHRNCFYICHPHDTADKTDLFGFMPSRRSICFHLRHCKRYHPLPTAGPRRLCAGTVPIVVGRQSSAETSAHFAPAPSAFFLYRLRTLEFAVTVSIRLNTVISLQPHAPACGAT